MGTKKIVLDTHVFLPGVSDSQRDPDSANVYKSIMEKCHRIVVNKRIIDEYSKISMRYGLPPLFIRDEIEKLKSIGKIQRTATFAGKNPISVGPEDDRCFAEAAVAAEADYIITRDAHFQAFEGLAETNRFDIVTPELYLKKEDC